MDPNLCPRQPPARQFPQASFDGITRYLRLDRQRDHTIHRLEGSVAMTDSGPLGQPSGFGVTTKS